MIGKNVDQITKKDLQTLIDNSVLERKTMEYKQSLPSNSDSDKKEFLADVSSFANASGGDLIYGIIEDANTGIPKMLDGLTIENVDREISRLDSMIRDGIEPRILGIVIKSVNLSNSKTVLIIRVPKSWISPHRVSFKGHEKFYSRSTNGKYPLDVSELRIAFNLSEAIAERIRKFREDRISKIFANEAPVLLYNNPKTILHLIPIISFNPAQSYEISKISSHPETMGTIYPTGITGYRYNIDGFLTYCEPEKGKAYSYVQLFKNGIIEAVEGGLLRPRDEELLIPSIAYEKALIESFTKYSFILKTLNVELPIFLFLTLLGVKGFSMSTKREIMSRYEHREIDRDVLLLPEIIVESYDDVAGDVLKPCFDSIWNACGYPRSMNYDDAGE